jgi:hypothetical protein
MVSILLTHSISLSKGLKFGIYMCNLTNGTDGAVKH